MNLLLEHKEKIFPIVTILLNLAAATIYFSSGDVKKGTYWTAAAVLTACVTF